MKFSSTAFPCAVLSVTLWFVVHPMLLVAQSSSKSTPRVQTSAEKLSKLEEAANKCRTAKEAVAVYQIFLADPKLTILERKPAEEKLASWEKLASEERVRVGKKWLTPAEEADLKKRADDLVVQAITLLETGALKAADQKLSQASQIYPDHLSSLFLLSVGALINRNYVGAEKQFSEMLKRAPNNTAILSNLAVAEAQIGRGERAFVHLQKAAEIDANHVPTLQNLGTLVGLFNDPRSKVNKTDKRIRDQAATFYAELRLKSKAKYNPAVDFLFDFRIDGENGEEVSKGEATPEMPQVVGNGTGFVIWDEYILTNRHVVEDSDGLAVFDPADSKKTFAGEVIAVSKNFDLAIVRCKGLKAPPVPFTDQPMARGAEVLALGFPITTVVGSGLKATRGIVTGLPSKDTDQMMVLDVQINPGNSGGPLCDSSGRVAGINTAVTFSSRFVQGYGLALPIQDAVPFIKEHIKDFQVTSTETMKKEWTEVDAAISKSTVLIMIKKKLSGVTGASGSPKK